MIIRILTIYILQGLTNGNVIFGLYGGVRLALTPQPSGWVKDSSGHYPACLGGRISSTSYMLYGTFKSNFISTGMGGVVTAFISYSDDKDEIDWEITGQDNSKAQTNFFYRGIIDYTKSQV